MSWFFWLSPFSKEDSKQYHCIVEDLREEITGMEEKMQELSLNNESLSEKLQNEEVRLQNLNMHVC